MQLNLGERVLESSSDVRELAGIIWYAFHDTEGGEVSKMFECLFTWV